MGAVSFTLDPRLVAELKRTVPLNLLVETGTFQGETIATLGGQFDEVISIELSKAHHEAARRRFSGHQTVRLILGDSAVRLAEVKDAFVNRSTLFWLDAHWCAAENTAGEESQCPLLAELTAIGSLNAESVILIDDARLFLAPPPTPHDISNWPSFDELIGALKGLSPNHSLCSWNDVILFVPRATFLDIRDFLHRTGINLLSVLDKSRGYDDLLLQAKAKETEITFLKATSDRYLSGWKGATNEAELMRNEVQRAHQQLRQGWEREEDFRRRIREVEDACAECTSTLAQTKRNCEAIEARAEQAEAFLDRLLNNQGGERKTHPGTATGYSPVIPWLDEALARRNPNPLGTLVQHQARPVTPEVFPVQRRPAAPPPRICLLTPSFQQVRFLARTMQSVIDQAYPNLAYGIQDGGSTDGSAELIESQIRHLTHAESARDRGQADAIAKGFKKLYPEPGDVMAWLNSDDMLTPGSLAFVGQYFAENPGVDVIYGHRIIIDESDKEVGRWFLPRHHRDSLPWFDFVPQETLFWRASAYAKVGGIDPTFHFAMDWDLLLRFEEAGLVIRRVPYFLGCFRIHESQKTSAKIHTLGVREMEILRFRTHNRRIPTEVINEKFRQERGRSARIAWMHRNGIRF